MNIPIEVLEQIVDYCSNIDQIELRQIDAGYELEFLGSVTQEIRRRYIYLNNNKWQIYRNNIKGD